MKQHITHPIFKIISESAKELEIEAFVIGGFVRDLLLNRKSKDVDIVAVGNGIKLAQLVASKIGNTQVNIFKNFGTAMLRYKDLEIEFVGARKESYRQSSRKPIVENGNLEDDQNRRDFTINALAISLHENEYGRIIDPFEGINDLKNKIIRTPLDPDITFSDDPLRMMRAIRLAAQLNFSIEENSFAAICRNKDRLAIVSMERITEELNKIILSDKPSIGFNLLMEAGLLNIFFPQMVALQHVEVINGKTHKNNFYHTLQVLDNISRYTNDLWLRWAAILHDIAKPLTKRFEESVGWTFHGHESKGAHMVSRIFRQLRLPLNEKMKFVEKMVLLHLRPIALAKSEVTESALRRLLFDAGNDIDDLMLLCHADITSKNEAKVKRYIKNFEMVRQKLKEVDEKDKLRNWQPPISGEEIMKVFNLPPGRKVGLIKNAIREAILEGEIKNNYQEAYQYMLKKAKEIVN